MACLSDLLRCFRDYDVTELRLSAGSAPVFLGRGGTILRTEYDFNLSETDCRRLIQSVLREKEKLRLAEKGRL
jgi:Tfp pilus assembly pilus retraction ATPase PilT